MRSKNEKFFRTQNFQDFILQHDTGNINKDSDFISRGMYYQSMKNWTKCFKLNDIHIVDGDNLKRILYRSVKKTKNTWDLDHIIVKQIFTTVRTLLHFASLKMKIMEIINVCQVGFLH